jgi:hypothetical protein
MLLGMILTLLWSFSAPGQTEDQLSARLKKVVAFEIRPGIDVYPSFAADGNVCRMVIEKRRYADPGNADFNLTIPNAVANQLVDELVPPTERGEPSKYLSTESFVAGGASFIKQDYQNVSVGMYGGSVEGKTNGATVIVITWANRTCVSNR